MQRVTFETNKQQVKLLKFIAAITNSSMSEIIRDAIKVHLNDKYKKESEMFHDMNV
jgi:hypothetical protein